MPISVSDYTDLLLGTLDVIQSDIIEPNSSGSNVETRYIAPNGRNDEEWLGYLRDNNNVVDIWLLTYDSLTGQDPQNAQEQPAVGTFDKPVSVIIDYYSDYRQGVDYNESGGKTNTEREFLKKVFAVDLALEMKKGCLVDNTFIRDWNFRMKLRRFDTASVHWASGVINIWFSGLFVN